ncbi:PREDICTED: uncharacterized protein LOC101297415 [Fragaria vesca subsp. vesca]|uniref:uncharacterized protein LOC101297415 n=1 Tax=Fragaria vesca subsp. vesca TaxID=101020 RepID=UPI0002C3162E|nr:PREDICTED: uncharacterized protein LOC101297415 [Fragaria vesca subsp. vesca]
MKLFQFALRSLHDGVSCRFHHAHSVRTLSTYAPPGGRMDDKQNSNSFESADDFEARIFRDTPEGNPKRDAFFTILDRLEKTSDGYASNQPGENQGGSHVLDGLDESFNTLSDGMDKKLKRAATYFQYDLEECKTDGYIFRPDANYFDGGTYEPKDLDLTKPAYRQPRRRNEFEVTTEEVLRKADFRNVRFLANFITEAGVLKKRSQTKISAKAQRKIAREIKTARAFGLMPFTTMGMKSFVFGKTMENLDADFEYESYDNPTADDGLGYM